MNKEGISIDWEKAFKFAIGIAMGVSVLHNFTPPICHRDLKSLNILISDTWDVKIADFGLARFLTSENMSTMTRLCGTYCYAAPELYNGMTCTAKCDIYSLGIILWEIVERVSHGKYSAPFAEFSYLKLDYQIFYHASKRNLRPTIPASCPSPLAQLISRIWDNDPEKRPKAEEIAHELEAIWKAMREQTTVSKEVSDALPSS